MSGQADDSGVKREVVNDLVKDLKTMRQNLFDHMDREDAWMKDSYVSI